MHMDKQHLERHCGCQKEEGKCGAALQPVLVRGGRMPNVVRSLSGGPEGLACQDEQIHMQPTRAWGSTQEYITCTDKWINKGRSTKSHGS
jgi:hypothetical protein